MVFALWLLKKAPHRQLLGCFGAGRKYPQEYRSFPYTYIFGTMSYLWTLSKTSPETSHHIRHIYFLFSFFSDVNAIFKGFLPCFRGVFLLCNFSEDFSSKSFLFFMYTTLILWFIFYFTLQNLWVRQFVISQFHVKLSRITKVLIFMFHFCIYFLVYLHSL